MLVCLGSFHPTDWPSHAVEPYPPTQNLCGSAGRSSPTTRSSRSGRASFPMMFFTGVCLVLLVCKCRLATSGCAIDRPAADVRRLRGGDRITSRPARRDGLPEGRGGIVGIAAGHFLHHYFSTDRHPAGPGG